MVRPLTRPGFGPRLEVKTLLMRLPNPPMDAGAARCFGGRSAGL